VPDVEIDAIRSLARVAQPEPAPYCAIGQRVRILDGPFEGIVGIIKEVKSRACLIVSIQLIEQSIRVDVSEFQFGPAT
jgi:transcription antitermination factor NusG